MILLETKKNYQINSFLFYKRIEIRTFSTKSDYQIDQKNFYGPLFETITIVVESDDPFIIDPYWKHPDGEMIDQNRSNFELHSNETRSIIKIINVTENDLGSYRFRWSNYFETITLNGRPRILLRQIDSTRLIWGIISHTPIVDENLIVCVQMHCFHYRTIRLIDLGDCRRECRIVVIFTEKQLSLRKLLITLQVANRFGLTTSEQITFDRNDRNSNQTEIEQTIEIVSNQTESFSLRINSIVTTSFLKKILITFVMISSLSLIGLIACLSSRSSNKNEEESTNGQSTHNDRFGRRNFHYGPIIDV